MAAQLFSGNEYGRAKTNKLNQLLNLQSDKGFFATSTLLDSAYPTGESGWYAHVGATDTIWSWTGSAWADSTVAPVVNMVNLSYDRIMANADFSVAQAGTSFTSVADGDFILDVYKYSKAGTVVHTVTQSTDVPTVAQAGHYIGYSMRLDTTTASLTSGSEKTQISGYVEGYDFRLIAQQDIPISFWHKHTVTGTYCVAFTNSGTDRTYIIEYTQTTTNTWEQATFTVSASPSAGTWDYANGTGLKIVWSFTGVGSIAEVADTWNSNSYLVTTSQVNGTATIGNLNMIADVRFGGSSVTSSEPNYEQKLAHVQRYYLHIPGGGVDGYFPCYAARTGVRIDTIPFPVEMRVAPPGSILTAPTYSGNASNPDVTSTTTKRAELRADISAASAGNRVYNGVYEFDARLA